MLWSVTHRLWATNMTHLEGEEQYPGNKKQLFRKAIFAQSFHFIENVLNFDAAFQGTVHQAKSPIINSVEQRKQKNVNLIVLVALSFFYRCGLTIEVGL